MDKNSKCDKDCYINEIAEYFYRLKDVLPEKDNFKKMADSIADFSKEYKLSKLNYVQIFGLWRLLGCDKDLCEESIGLLFSRAFLVGDYTFIQKVAEILKKQSNRQTKEKTKLFFLKKALEGADKNDYKKALKTLSPKDISNPKYTPQPAIDYEKNKKALQRIKKFREEFAKNQRGKMGQKK